MKPVLFQCQRYRLPCLSERSRKVKTSRAENEMCSLIYFVSFLCSSPIFMVEYGDYLLFVTFLCVLIT